MAQKYANLLDILLNNREWPDDWNRNVAIIQDAFRTFKINLVSTIGTTYTIEIFQQDAIGNYITNEQFFLRLRSVPWLGYQPSVNAALSVVGGTGTTLIETIATNDIVVQSANSGFGLFSAVTVQIYDIVPESFSLLIGPPNNPKFANYNNQLDFVTLYPVLNTSNNPVLNASGAAIFR